MGPGGAIVTRLVVVVTVVVLVMLLPVVVVVLTVHKGRPREGEEEGGGRGERERAGVVECGRGPGIYAPQSAMPGYLCIYVEHRRTSTMGKKGTR